MKKKYVNSLSKLVPNIVAGDLHLSAQPHLNGAEAHQLCFINSEIAVELKLKHCNIHPASLSFY